MDTNTNKKLNTVKQCKSASDVPCTSKPCAWSVPQRKPIENPKRLPSDCFFFFRAWSRKCFLLINTNPWTTILIINNGESLNCGKVLTFVNNTRKLSTLYLPVNNNQYMLFNTLELFIDKLLMKQWCVCFGRGWWCFGAD